MRHKRCGLKFTQHLSKMNLTSRERNSDESIKLHGSSVQLVPAQASWGGEGERVLVALPRRLSRAFGKRQACKRDEVRLPSR